MRRRSVFNPYLPILSVNECAPARGPVDADYHFCAVIFIEFVPLPTSIEHRQSLLQCFNGQGIRRVLYATLEVGDNMPLVYVDV